ncbi:hypothetical protein [Leuconostoc mesenteroides]|uniref:hypothetical protein n=1 Tax=Leuconostoc mesenteroides TaxID=1245 RepID=UPI0021C1CD4B|nr:hypothetical protein [Leuconostoc mesenteroides]MCT8386081.1 hypothetical protein [Leuconostoc mesenteroides]
MANSTFPIIDSYYQEAINSSNDYFDIPFENNISVADVRLWSIRRKIKISDVLEYHSGTHVDL